MREGWILYRSKRDIDSKVDRAIRQAQEVEGRIDTYLDGPLSGKRVLDAGCGHELVQLAWFGRRNEVVGFDFDVLPRGLWDVAAYLRSVRLNGWRRALKTLLRQLLRIDARFSQSLARGLGVRALPQFTVIQGDLTRMPFADGSFDVAHARSVLQHVPTPEKVIGELARVLAPGGVGYALVPLPTAPYAGSDARLWGADQGRFEPWMYLRQRSELVKGAYLNDIRLAEWQALFEAAMPGSQISLNYARQRSALEGRALALKQAGELRDFSLTELLARSLEVIWKKPR